LMTDSLGIVGSKCLCMILAGHTFIVIVIVIGLDPDATADGLIIVVFIVMAGETSLRLRIEIIDKATIIVEPWPSGIITFALFDIIRRSKTQLS
jgi:hypothetical protein